MRVVVNRTLCESNAVCARLVPEIFVINDDDRLQRPGPSGPVLRFTK